MAGARNAAAGVAIGAGVDSAAVAFAPVATRPRPRGSVPPVPPDASPESAAATSASPPKCARGG